MPLLDEVEAMREEAEKAIAGADSPDALEAARVAYLGRSGKLKDFMSRIREVPADQKKAAGQRLNEIKSGLETLFAGAKDRIGAKAVCARPLPDPTLPGRIQPLGSVHPLTQALERFAGIFERLGFTVRQGPEIEDVFHNFDALNMPDDHPVRDQADTFALEDNAILRSQTSTVQIRVMEEHVGRHGGGAGMPPIRIVSPGRTYRPDAVDATHHYSFSQIEGLAVDRDVAMADLKGFLGMFARETFGSGVKTRFRPSFFPFTEPSAEMDVSCVFCGGKGCRVCKRQGWVELGGCGMVDPNVFDAVGIDRELFTGFAFGFGIERVAMFMLGVDDIRRFTENDLRFLRQF
ncbi:MAG: phenylalanine--tRNA ligase subunit alpha [Planctomycetota bacterium]|jgi:phenylalanyl-tRNA synthetase alpha chain|nr:phenylalanine--tRNA ligase subunit alpha [Planctomycetota bacterium]